MVFRNRRQQVDTCVVDSAQMLTGIREGARDHVKHRPALLRQYDALYLFLPKTELTPRFPPTVRAIIEQPALATPVLYPDAVGGYHEQRLRIPMWSDVVQLRTARGRQRAHASRSL